VSKINMLGQLLKPIFPHIALVISAIMFGLGIGYIKVATLPPEIDIADNWTLPRWSPYQPSLPSRELAALELWGEDERVQELIDSSPRDASAWRFIGIVQDGENRVAIIELGQNGGLQRLSEGDLLPNGAEILDIGTNELTLQDESLETTIRLFDIEKS
jgi:hypothetical protein